MTRYLSILLAATLCACSPQQEAREQHYTSPVVQGNTAAIDLGAVEKAFTESHGQDFNSWMSAFEKRVNEIYTGTGVVSIDAQRKDDRLVVQGFVDKNGQEGLQAGDEKLFTLEQTGPATQDTVPVRTSDGAGQVYHEGSLGLLGNPFLQAFLLTAMFSHWGGHYYTPAPQLVVLANHRSLFQRTPAYHQQVVANRQFQSRFQQRAGGGVASRRTWGAAPAASQPRRTWGNWAGRSTTGGGGGILAPRGGGLSAPRGRSWGGRRR